MYCKHCGTPIPDGTKLCAECSKKLGTQPQPADSPIPQDKEPNKLPLILLGAAILIAAIVAIAVGASGSSKCGVSSCNNKAVEGMSYCYSHKCSVTSCDNKRSGSSNYCYSHALLYDTSTSSSSTSHVYTYQLKVSDVKITTNSVATYAEGSLTNNSSETVRFVKIKGTFKDKSGNVVDTDWTYAAGSEGLAPGESCKWKMYVDKDSSIKECEVSILDYS